MMAMIFLIFNFAQAADLNGVWKMKCQASPAQDYFQPQITIENENWTEEIPFFENADCRNEYLSFTLTWKSQTSGQNLDLESRDFSVTPKTEETADSMNMMGYCGLTNWQTGKSQSIAGRFCNEVGQAFAPGTKIYSIFRLESNRLFLGTRNGNFDGKTPEKRHTQWDQPYLFEGEN